MRLLHVSQRYWPARGGAELHLQRICEALAQTGHALTVATTDVAEIDGFARRPYRYITPRVERRNGVLIIRFPIRQPPVTPRSIRLIRRLMAEWSRRGASVRLLRRLASFGHAAPELVAWLRTQSGQFDAVGGMGIGYEWLLWPAYDFARRERVPFLLHPLLHLGEDGVSAQATGRHPSLKDYYTMRHQVALMQASERVFAQTPREADFLKTVGVPSERIVGAGIGIDPDEVTGGDATQVRARLQTTAPLILSLGTQSEDKGSLDLLLAMQQLWSAGSDAHLILAGVVLPEVAAALQCLPPDAMQRIHTLGSVADDVKRDLLAACDVLAIPSRAESFGIVVLEAWANAKPVIGAQAGALPDVIDDGRNGLLVPFGNPAALSAALGLLLGDAALRERLGRAGRAKLLARYQWQTIYPTIRDAYERYDPARH